MKIDCSNCMATIDLDLEEMTVSHTVRASGRGSKRTPEKTTTNGVSIEDDTDLFVWEAPCCLIDGEPYSDSLEQDSEAFS
jgi:hypothetical protein